MSRHHLTERVARPSIGSMSAPLGWIYALVNPSMPGLVKVGCTIHDPVLRAKQLSASTSAPVPFVVAYSRRVAVPFQVEAALHRYLAPYRANDSREFFKIPLHEVVRLMDEYEEVPELPPLDDEDGESAANMDLPWSELFATFPDDGSGRELTAEEAAECREMAELMGQVIGPRDK